MSLTWVCHRVQDGFLGGKLNSRMKGKHRGWQHVSGGVRVQEAGAVQPGAGLPGTGNSAPTVMYNPTVSVS